MSRIKTVREDDRATWLRRIRKAKVFRFKQTEVRRFIALETLRALSFDTGKAEQRAAIATFKLEGAMIDAAFEAIVGKAEIEFSGDGSANLYRFIAGVTDALYSRLADVLAEADEAYRAKLKREAGL